MKQFNFDLVILGNEPAGLWLANHYVQARPEAAVAWIPLQAQSLAIPLLSSIAAKFSINDLSQSEFFEFISTSGAQSTEPAGFQSNPRRDIFAKCLWKGLSRSQSVGPEINLIEGYSPLSFGYWNPSLHSSRQISHFTVPEEGHEVEKFEIHKDKSVTLRFKNMGSVRSLRWVINTSLTDWAKLTKNIAPTVQLFNPEVSFFNPSWMVPIETSAPEEVLNQFLKPFSILLESEHLPHPLYEAWVLEASKSQESIRTLRLWIDLPPGQSPSEVMKWSKKGIAALTRIFPSFMDPLFEPPKQFFNQAIERYRSSLLSPYTRNPALFCLGPYVNCHLPYPQGTLESAQKLLQNWLGSSKQTKLA